MLQLQQGICDGMKTIKSLMACTKDFWENIVRMLNTNDLPISQLSYMRE